MTTPHAKTAEEVAKKIAADYDARMTTGASTLSEDDQFLREAIAAAIREANENGQRQAYDHVEKARHLPGDKLRTVRVDHGIVDGLRQIEMRTAAPESCVLDDAGNVRRVLPFNANGKLIGYIFAENENFMQFTLTNLNLHAKDAHAGEKGAAHEG